MSTRTQRFAFEQLESSAPPDPHDPDHLIECARAEAGAIRERARSEGLQAGFDAGCEQGLEAARSAALALQTALSELLALREQLVGALEQDAVALALALAGKIIAGALDVEPQRVLDVIAGALRHIADRRKITVLVDPVDMEIVQASLQELSAKAGGVELCELHADRRVGRGGAIVRTPEGEVDACVDTQLEQAREAVAAELGAHSEGR
jgi:flagellar assembly protein FliH